MDEADTWCLFATPVSDEFAPNYSKIITWPMDLATMRGYVDKRMYHTLEAFDADVMRMFRNCRKFNGEHGEEVRSTLNTQCALTSNEEDKKVKLDSNLRGLLRGGRAVVVAMHKPTLLLRSLLQLSRAKPSHNRLHFPL